jgi:hypothetical protein
VLKERTFNAYIECCVELCMSGITNWDDVIKKEARGIDDYDLAEVHDVDSNIVVTKKGVVDKDKFYLPKSRAVRFDGHKVWFNVTKDEAKAYKKD